MFIILVWIMTTSVFAVNTDPIPLSEVLLLKNTSKIEDYNWAPLYHSKNLGSACQRSDRVMCQAQAYANSYVRNMKHLKTRVDLPQNADYPALIQSVWAVKNADVSVDDTWKTLISYLKLQRSMTDMRSFLGESASDSRSTVFRGSVYPHLVATASNFSVFHKVQGFLEGLKVAGADPVHKIQLNRIKFILAKAFGGYREQLSRIKMDMTQPHIDAQNLEKLKLRQMFSLAQIFDVLKKNLASYNIRELTVLETIDSYESLPAHFYLYTLFLKENQNRMIQVLDKEHLSLLFNLVLLSDLIQYSTQDDNFEIVPVELSAESNELVKLIQKELSIVMKSYENLIELGVAL